MADQQGELFRTNTLWFHVFHQFVDSGDAAALSHASFKILIVLKSFVNFKNGAAFPRHTLLAQKSGCSVATVKRSLAELEKHGYLEKTKRGRKNTYIVKEKFKIENGRGQQVAVAHCDYIPELVEAMRSELKHHLSEQAISNSTIQIKTLNIQIVNQGTHGLAIQFNAEEPLSAPTIDMNRVHP